MGIFKIFNKIKVKFYYKTDSERYIRFLRLKGIKIGDNCIFRGPSSTEIDITKPSLVEIGNFVDMNLNFTILTHDYGSFVFLRKYKAFVNSTGKVKIGNNIYFGKNCTILKGVTIGDNCIIGACSTIVKDIPPNSVAVGSPAKVICSIDEYFEKRKAQSVEEAFEYARSIQERFGRRPVEGDFTEEFPLFVNGADAEKYPTIPIKFQMQEAYGHWSKNHVALFKSFDDFLKAAGVH